MNEFIHHKKLILASASPRRKFLLEQTGLQFEIIRGEVDEDYPEGMTPPEIAVFLAEKKALHFSYAIQDNDTILITADTIVCLGDKVLGKPGNFEEAFEMLQMLSGKEHKVYTGVTLKSLEKTYSFYAVTNVHFSVLSPEEITHYITHFKPYDKAGAYGIQEWIGYIAIDRIEGSYFNVVGLPVHRLYSELKKF